MLDFLCQPNQPPGFEFPESGTPISSESVLTDEGMRLVRGDNLHCLRTLLEDEAESFDLIYLDPPFGTGRDFTTKDGRVAFEDTRTGSEYLAHLWPRLTLCHQLLKPDGTLYLHLAPRIAPYVRILAERLFGHLKSYHRSLIWKRSISHPNAKSFAATHDVILFYPKSSRFTFNHQYRAVPQNKIVSLFPFEDERGRFATSDLTGSTLKTAHDPNYTYRWGDHTRTWRCRKSTMERFEREGRIYYSNSGLPRRKRYSDEHLGIPFTDVWDDIPGVPGSEERSIGYPTQKPERLLERVILSSSRKGDKVLDPYCGSGTSLIVARRLERKWVGIDKSPVAIETVKTRLGNL